MTKKKYQDKTALVYDYGIFTSIAHRLAKDFGKVYYYNPSHRGFFPTSANRAVGAGYDDFERIFNFWNVIDKIDLFVFPDVNDGDLQIYLSKIGKNVWGSREGEMLEIDRVGFLDHLTKLGLNTPHTEVVKGLDALDKRLQKVDEKWIKLEGQVRGDCETFFHKEYRITRPLLDKLRLEIGPLGSDRDYLIQDPIEGDIELGFDTFMVAGEFPETIQWGVEIKDLGYVCKVMKFEDMPKEMVRIFDVLRTTFVKYNYTGFFSAEVRVDDEGLYYFSDPCCRSANPASFVGQLLMKNYSEIMYEGSQGNMVQPEWNAKYGVEITINSEWIKDHFGEIYYPDDMKESINRMNTGVVDGVEYAIPNGVIDSYGSLAVIDDDANKMMDRLMDDIGKIEGYQVNIDCKNIDLALEFIK